MGMIWIAAMLMMPAAGPRPAMDSDPAALFAELEAGVNGLPLAPEMRVSLLGMIGTARVHSTDATTSPFSVIEILQALTSQLAEILPLAGEDQVLPLIAKSDEICALLFFEAGPLAASLAPVPAPPPDQCTVRILARLIGPVLNDPAGVLYVRFADLVQFEAQASEEGGVFDWFVSPAEPLFQYIRGPRLSLRAASDSTLVVSIRYQKGPKVCTDLILLPIQGGFPE